MIFSADETTDIGYESRTTVTADYTAPGASVPLVRPAAHTNPPGSRRHHNHKNGRLGVHLCPAVSDTSGVRTCPPPEWSPHAAVITRHKSRPSRTEKPPRHQSLQHHPRSRP
jgi:hypothetical protein